MNLQTFDCPICDFHFQADMNQIHDDGLECPQCRRLFNPNPEPDEPNDSMDGDFESGMASAGHGMDESYEHNLCDEGGIGED